MRVKWIGLFCLWMCVHLSKGNDACVCGYRFTQCPETPDPVLEGSTLDLECSIRDFETCFWTERNTAATRRVSNPDGSCDWKIHNITHDYTGRYTCGAFVNDLSKALCSAEIDVKVATALQKKNLHLISRSKDMTLSSEETPGKGGSAMPVIQLSKEDFNNSEVVCLIENASLAPTATFSIGTYFIQRHKMIKFSESRKSPADLTYAAFLQRSWEDHDNGQTLKCSVHYDEAPKLKQYAETSVYLNVTYIPFLLQEYYHVKLGITEDKVIEIKSNPPLRQDEVTVTQSGTNQQLLTYEVVENQDDICEVDITVDAKDIVQETYWNITIGAREQQLPVYIHIAGNPDASKTKGRSKGGSKGGTKEEQRGSKPDPEEQKNKDEKEDNNDPIVVVCVILVVLLIIAGVTAYLLWKRNRSKDEEASIDKGALYKPKGKKDFKDLSAIPEESQQDQTSRAEQGTGKYQMMQEEGEMEEKPSPQPRSRVKPEVGEYQEMQNEEAYEEREVVAKQEPEQKSKDDEPAVLEVSSESK